jgi:hypothetical protein
MARNGAQEGTRISDCKQIEAIAVNFRSLSQQINTMAEQMIGLQTKMTAGLASGLYEQVDLDMVAVLAGAWITPLPNGTTFQSAIAAFLSSGIGMPT